jgi:hypothetical protein
VNPTSELFARFAECPTDPALWLEMGRHVANHGDHERAIGIYAALADAAPNHLPAWYELGLCYEQSGQYGLAAKAFQHASTIAKGKEGFGIAQSNLGACLYRMGAPKNGAIAWDQALRDRDSRPYARWTRSLIRLARGDWRGGWRDYEARWEVPQLADQVKAYVDPSTLPPRWDGGPTDGPVLVYAEQGVGDCIWALRYLEHVAKASGHAPILRVPASLQPLVTDPMDPQEGAVASAPLMSLPYLLGMPAPIGPNYYRLGSPTEPTGRIGYCYKGAPSHGNDKDRSSPVSFADSLEQAGLTPVSLQHGEPHTFADYAETADLMATCDAVLTVDTSVAHLAGTLGVPTVVIPPVMPDWRWPGTGSTTPWYDSITVIRRTDVTHRSWADAIQRAVQHLKDRS